MQWQKTTQEKQQQQEQKQGQKQLQQLLVLAAFRGLFLCVFSGAALSIYSTSFKFN